MVNSLNILRVATEAFKREKHLQNIAEAHEGRLTVTHNGGMWKIDHSFIALLSVLVQRGETAIIPDMFRVPRTVNPKELLETSMQRYEEVMNSWKTEYAKAARIRNAENLRKDMKLWPPES